MLLLLIFNLYIFNFYLFLFHFSQLNFPEFLIDQDFKNLIQLMLNKNKEIRYSKFEQISGHVWFKNFDWDALISLDILPEYLPKIDEKEDMMYSKKSYIDYINDCPEWENQENKHKITEQNQKEFDEWINNF